MTLPYFVLPLLLIVSLSTLGVAGEPKAANYELDLSVIGTGRTDVNTYFLQLGDATRIYLVACNNRNHMHGCRTFTAGERVRGHLIEQKQTKLFSNAGAWMDIFWVDEKGKPKHEEWTVNSMSGSSPVPSSPGSAENDEKSSKTTPGADVGISSTPSGADIEIDDKFVGTTPSTIGVAPGEHNIAVKKTGFLTWQRKVAVTGGHINVNAELAPDVK